MITMFIAMKQALTESIIMTSKMHTDILSGNVEKFLEEMDNFEEELYDVI
jgi:hypothetical protein